MSRPLRDKAVEEAARVAFRRYGLPDCLELPARRPLPAPTFGLQMARIGISIEIVASIRDTGRYLSEEDRVRLFWLIDAAAQEAGR
jgi:hypothetical protein